MKGMEPRLLSSLNGAWQLIFSHRIWKPGLPFCKKDLYNDGIEMPEEVIEYLAYSINTNVSELEGALISIMPSHL